jgi:hypothetical protein
VRLNPNVAAVYSNLAGSLFGLDRINSETFELTFGVQKPDRGKEVLELYAKESRTFALPD